ncbi:MAG: phosphatidate cytidylyltransferase [Eggerthellaceae bacterium]|jgi:phosphatidate cytidylyltransferase|nr:phosphatidate cytidylyltransferase [Eggerthellaceae bacterium]MDR2721274.1 phosphatidate cytidylyltransferase [Coriobacteriaceae bacterium]
MAKKDDIKEFARGKTPKKLKNPNDFQIRLRTSVIYFCITLICIFINDLTTVIMLSATAGICAGEFYYMLRSDAKLPNEIVGVVGAALYPWSVWLFGLMGALLLTVLLVVVLLIWYVFWMRARVADVGVSLFGALYTGLLLSGLIIIRSAESLEFPWAGILLFAVYLGVWANDVFAYLVGRKLGKHKLAPRTSPKKSWEGFFAGLVGSVLIWIGISFIPGVSMSMGQAIVFGLVCGLLGVLGDLAESRIKRNSGFKDSGTIMPGHGGLLDRCDSLFLVSVAAAILLVVGGCIPYGG